MIKRVVITLVVIALATGAIIFANRRPLGTDSLAAIYPWSYAITGEQTGLNAAINLPLTLLDRRQDSKRTDPSLFGASIITQADYESGALENQFRVDITEVSAGSTLTFKGAPVYTYNYSAKVPLSCFFTYEDAHLLLSYNDGSSEALYLGDISFIHVPENCADSQHLKKLRALPVVDISTLTITAYVIEFSASDEALLESFEFGLPKYGIDTSRVVCLHESMDRIEKLYFERTIDKVVKGIYTLPVTNNPVDSLGSIRVQPGVNTLIIPFTWLEGANLSPVSVLGGLLHYTVAGEPYTYLFESMPCVAGVSLTVVEEHLNNVWP